MATPYSIPSGGNCSGGASFGSSFSPFGNANMGYQTALNYNNNLYNNIVQGYQSLGSSLNAGIAPITQGYGDLYNNVLGQIQGVQQSQLNAVQCQYTKSNAANQQQAINSGLGNSTVLQSLQRGACAQKSLATTQVNNQFAQLMAGYMSQLGLAKLNWEGQALGMCSALGNQALQTMAGFRMTPPCAGYSCSNRNKTGPTTFGPTLGSHVGAGGGPDQGRGCAGLDICNILKNMGGGGGQNNPYGGSMCRPGGPTASSGGSVMFSNPSGAAGQGYFGNSPNPYVDYTGGGSGGGGVGGYGGCATLGSYGFNCCG